MQQKKVNGLCTPSRSEEAVTMSATGEQYVVDEHGNRVAIILPLQEYEQLQEDLHDLAVVAERREEPSVGFDEFRKRYER
jgi:PHD/YefM family antitoxin component YafN of YafNO toxin-antitoxin module